MSPQETTSRSAETWLAGADRQRRYDIVIVWGHHPDQTAILPCGVRWDAIRTPTRIGLPALDGLLDSDDRHKVGPVLQDHRSSDLYWLIPTGTGAGQWDQLPHAQHLGHGHRIAAPAPSCTEGWPAEWIHWPQTTGILTPPHLLAAALKAAAGT